MKTIQSLSKSFKHFGLEIVRFTDIKQRINSFNLEILVKAKRKSALGTRKQLLAFDVKNGQ